LYKWSLYQEDKLDLFSIPMDADQVNKLRWINKDLNFTNAVGNAFWFTHTHTHIHSLVANYNLTYAPEILPLNCLLAMCSEFLMLFTTQMNTTNECPGTLGMELPVS